MPRGNVENLRPAALTSEEAMKRGKQGGINSGIARRKKRDAKEAAKLFLDMAVTEQLDKNLEQLMIKEGDRTNLMAIMARMTLLAQSGSINAAKLLLEVTDSLPKNNPENNFSVNVGKDTDDNVVIVIPDNGRDGYLSEN